MIEMKKGPIETKKQRFSYKQVQELKPYCSYCKEFLIGDGSHNFPYKCRCGEWSRSLDINDTLYYLIKPKTN